MEFFIIIIILLVNLSIGLSPISDILQGEIFHRLDIIICINSIFSTIDLFKELTFSMSVLEMKSCCPTQPNENPKYLLHHSAIVLWFADADSDGPEVSWSTSLASLFKCVQTRESGDHEIFPSSGQPLYHIVLTRSEPHNGILEYLKNNVTIFLQPPHELLLCSVLPTLQCMELYHIQSKVVVQSISQIETAIIELSLRRLNFFRETIPGVALDMPGYVGKSFKPRLKPDDPLEFDGGYSIERYRYIRDSLNFTELAKASKSALPRNKVNDTLENGGVAEFLNSEESIWAMGEWEFVPYRVRGKYGLRYLHGSVSDKKPVAIFVQPKDEDAKVYKRPFQATVWQTLSLIACFIFVTFTLLVYRNQGQVHDGPTPSTSIFLRAFWCTVESLLLKVNQTTLSLYTTDSIARLVTCTILLLIFILQGIYTSTLTSILTIDYDKIQTFQQLKDSGFQLILYSQTPSLRSTVTFLENKENIQVGEIKDVFPRVLDSKVALVTAPTEFRTFLPPIYKDEFLCEKLYLITLSRFPIKAAYLIKRGSPYRNTFNIKLLKMFETGNEHRIKRDQVEKSSLICPMKSSVSFYSMSLQDTKLVFIFLLSATCASLLLLLFEHLLMIQKSPNDTQTNNHT